MKCNFKKRNELYQSKLKGEMIDTGIGIGMSMAVSVLHDEFGFGRERAYKFAKEFLLKLENEFKRGAEKLTKEYEDNIDQGMYHLNKDIRFILGDEYLEKLENLDF